MGKKDWLSVQVIAIEVREGSYIEEKKQVFRAYTEETTYKMSKPDPNAPKKTLVLYTANGELKTKEFDGQWTLAQVNAWNKERFMEELDG